MIVYFLFSESSSRYYVGITSDLDDRLRRHNSGFSKATKHGVPWKLVRIIKVGSRSEAMKIEKQIKSRGIKRWLSENP